MDTLVRLEKIKAEFALETRRVINMQDKLFRNCPYEREYTYEFEQKCSRCPYYWDICYPRKKKLREEREQKRRENMRKMMVVILATVMIVAAIIICAFCSIKEQSDQEQNNQSTGMVETVSLGFVVAKEQSINLLEKSTISTEIEVNQVKSMRESESAVQISSYGPSEGYYYTFSEQDKVYIAKLVFVEARGECFKGKVAVAAVAINRYFSNISWYDTSSIYAVITQRSQFADISEVTMEDLEHNPDCMEAVEAACKGWDPTREVFEDGARYFYAPELIGPEEASRREGVLVLSIGNHNFHNDFAD